MKILTLKTHNNPNIQAKLLAAFLNVSGVTVEFEAENEDMSPSDMEFDEVNINYIEREFNRGNGYAWFCAKVTVRYRGYEAIDYLGCCSYKSERDFKENSGYYVDMIRQCVDEINKDITAHNNQVCTMFKTRRLKAMAAELGFIVIPKTAIV
jgi:hypothetical protein